MNDASIPPAAAYNNYATTQPQQESYQPTSPPPQQPPPPVSSVQQQQSMMHSPGYMNTPVSMPPQQQQYPQPPNNVYNPPPNMHPQQVWQQQPQPMNPQWQQPPNAAAAYNYPQPSSSYAPPPQQSYAPYQQPYVPPNPRYQYSHPQYNNNAIPPPTHSVPQSGTPWMAGGSSMPQQAPSSSNPSAARATGRFTRPPYVDPTTHIAYDVDQPDYEGWLTKQSEWLKEWRRRYFILKGSKLFFCKHPTSGAPHGMMDLSICTTVKSADLKSGKRHSFEISTPDTCYLLYADTEAEKDDWIGRVGKAIVRCSRTYYKGESTVASNSNQHQEEDDDDIYENDDPDSPYFND